MLEMPEHGLGMCSLSGRFCASKQRFGGLFLLSVGSLCGMLMACAPKDASCLPPAGILSQSLCVVINPGESGAFSYSELQRLSNS